ncbi:MAG: D-aminoacyl-tRNA deacylase [Actinomycetota bacterium]|nr:D-aminoacyl-tRNA deacylase [Actinomycetota bacterium]
MRLVIQRVSSAAVTVSGERIAGIGAGLLVLAGVGKDDNDEAARRLARKVAALRIFGDDDGKMNRSLTDVGGEALVVSQFTLYADTKKGYRPSFVAAARPELAVPVLEAFVAGLRSAGVEVAEGRFRARMEVSLVNDGPVTILLEG